MDEFNPMLTSLSVAELLELRAAYSVLRVALCDIEGGVADTIGEAQVLARMALERTPLSLDPVIRGGR